MKKLFAAIAVCALTVACALTMTACDAGNTIYVNTNAFFAPFEYYDGDEIKGVDIDIMNMVGEKLGKKVIFENTEFGPIIDNVQSGKIRLRRGGNYDYGRKSRKSSFLHPLLHGKAIRGFRR